MVIGENGIFEKANTAKEKTIEAQAEEDVQLKVLETQASNDGKFAYSKFMQILNDSPDEYIVKDEDGNEVTELQDNYEGDITVINRKYNIEVGVSEDLEIKSQVSKTDTISELEIISYINEQNENIEDYFTINAPDNEFGDDYLFNENQLLTNNTINTKLIYGHYNGIGDYSAYYILDVSKLPFNKITKIEADFNHYKENADSTNTYIQVWYSDETKSEEIYSTYCFDETWTKYKETDGTIETRYTVSTEPENKTINYIKFGIKGYDGDSGGFMGAIRTIRIYGIKKYEGDSNV